MPAEHTLKHSIPTSSVSIFTTQHDLNNRIACDLILLMVLLVSCRHLLPQRTRLQDRRSPRPPHTAQHSRPLTELPSSLRHTAQLSSSSLQQPPTRSSSSQQQQAIRSKPLATRSSLRTGLLLLLQARSSRHTEQQEPLAQLLGTALLLQPQARTEHLQPDHMQRQQLARPLRTAQLLARQPTNSHRQHSSSRQLSAAPPTPHSSSRLPGTLLQAHSSRRMAPLQLVHTAQQRVQLQEDTAQQPAQRQAVTAQE
jgi:hypothetical protein